MRVFQFDLESAVKCWLTVDKLTGNKSPLRLLKELPELHELMSDLAVGDICWEKGVADTPSRGTSKKGREVSRLLSCCCWCC